MAYKRIVTQDGVTVMNKDLYDNLQDGIDESKQAVQDLEDNVEESLKEVNKDIGDVQQEVQSVKNETGGIKFDGERDMIMIKNPFTGEWIDWQSSGKIILPSTITITTNTLGGKQVTCSIGGKTYTSEFSIISGTQGVVVFTVYEDGKAVITCESYTTSVTVQEKGGGTYTVELEEEVLLWDGTSFHNGMTWLPNVSPNSFKYINTLGNLEGKRLKYVISKSEKLHIALQVHKVIDSSFVGTVYLMGNSVGSTYYQFSAGTEYEVDFKDIKNKINSSLDFTDKFFTISAGNSNNSSIPVDYCVSRLAIQ